MITLGQVTSTAASSIVALRFDEGDGDTLMEALGESRGLLAVSDAGRIAEWVEQAIAANPQAVDDVAAGGKKQKKAFGFLMGQVMQLSKGAAAPAEVQKLLREKLGR